MRSAWPGNPDPHLPGKFPDSYSEDSGLNTIPLTPLDFACHMKTVPRLRKAATHTEYVSWNDSKVRFGRDGYPLDSPSPNGLCFAGRFFGLWMNDLVAGHRINGDGLLREAKEELSPTARPAPVEPERELIQIVAQMFVADRTLMRSHEPSFQQRDHQVNPRQQL